MRHAIYPSYLLDFLTLLRTLIHACSPSFMFSCLILQTYDGASDCDVWIVDGNFNAPKYCYTGFHPQHHGMLDRMPEWNIIQCCDLPIQYLSMSPQGRPRRFAVKQAKFLPCLSHMPPRCAPKFPRHLEATGCHCFVSDSVTCPFVSKMAADFLLYWSRSINGCDGKELAR